MSEIETVDDQGSIRICHECVREVYLSAEIKRSGTVGLCTYCAQTAPSITIDDLAERIEAAFEAHYVRTADQPNSWQERMQADRESDYEWDRDGVPVIDAIADAAEIPRGAAEDVQAILDERHGDFDMDAVGEETEFSADSHYAERGPDYRDWQEEWFGFVYSIKTQARFFSRSATNHLAEVFGDIDKLKTRNARAVVVNAGPKSSRAHFYRARVFQTDDSLREALRQPDRHLGSPPQRMARAGRMNAQGISVFYGATTASVALAEVRAPVGSRVVVAKFRIRRKLRLLDLTALRGVHVAGSVFDASMKRQLERAAFLRTLGLWMAQPVMPDDESIDYLPTQAVADFLATMNEPRLDGIIFPSAQAKTGLNVVLFHHAAKVAESPLAKDAEVTADLGHWSDEGWEIDYWVMEEVPPQPAIKQPVHDDGFFTTLSGQTSEQPRWGEDFREASLEIDRDSVKVHHVNSVKVNSTSYSVQHFSVEKRNQKF